MFRSTAERDINAVPSIQHQRVTDQALGTVRSNEIARSKRVITPTTIQLIGQELFARNHNSSILKSNIAYSCINIVKQLKLRFTVL